MNDKAIAALEALLEALKSEGSQTVAAAVPAAPKGNRTPARTDYAGGNANQDLVDVARRFVRLSREGTVASKKERKLARKVIKAVKVGGGIWNTNGVDVFTHNGL